MFQQPSGIAEARLVACTPGEKFHLQGLIGSSRSVLVATLAESVRKPVVVCLNDREEAAYFFDDLVTLQCSSPVFFFPSSYKRSVQYGQIEQENIVLRTEVLNKLKELEQLVVVTYPEALTEKVISGESLDSHTFRVKKGDKLSIAFVNEVLYEYGFERVDFVFEPGQYSIRGSLVDIYSFSNEDPYRIDFFGDEVDSIRSFDIESQISKEQLTKVFIIPNIQESLTDEKRVPFLEFIPKQSLVVMHDAEFTADQVENDYRQTLIREQDPELAERWPDKIITGDDLLRQLLPLSCIETGARRFFREAEVLTFATLDAALQPAP